MDIVTLEIIIAVLGTLIYCAVLSYCYRPEEWKYRLYIFLFILIIIFGLYFAYEILMFLFGK